MGVLGDGIPGKMRHKILPLGVSHIMIHFFGLGNLESFPRGATYLALVINLSNGIYFDAPDIFFF